MPKKDRNYVTINECNEKAKVIHSELSTIKKALIGDDMLGGLVKQVTDMKADLKTALKISKLTNEHNGLGRKERVTIYSSAIITTGLVISKVIEFLA